MYRGRYALLFIMVLLQANACSNETGISKSESDIIGGSADAEAAHDAVLFLMRTGGELCTATLISPRVVVTAKHCVYGVSKYDLWLGAGEDIFFDMRYAKISEVRMTEGLETKEKDIAVLLLDKEGSAAPVPWKHNVGALLGDSVTLVGYGQRNVGALGQGSSGIKYQTSSTIMATSSFELAVEGPSTCFGDSGGPAMVSDGTLVGVVSRGQSDCNGLSILTRVDAYSQMIDQAIMDTGGIVDSSPSAQSLNTSSISAEGATATGGILIGAPTVGGGGCSIASEAIKGARHGLTGSILPLMVGLYLVVLRRKKLWIRAIGRLGMFFQSFAKRMSTMATCYKVKITMP